MKTRVKVEGLKEIQAALQELPKATAKNIMKRVLLKRAEPIVQAAKQNVPVLSGELRDSIVASTKSTGGSAGKKAFAQAMASGATSKQAGAAAREANRATSGSIFVYIGPSKLGYYGMFQEFGTKDIPPQPWLRPAWDQNKDGVLTGIASDMWVEIEKAVERRAKKLARAGK